MNDQKRMAVVRLSSDAIRDLLQLPREAELLRVTFEDGRRDGGVVLLFGGVGQMVSRGEPLPPADVGTITRSFLDDGRELAHKITWPFLRTEPEGA